MYNRMNILLVDDEPIALNGLEKYVARVSYFNIVDTCENAYDAKDALEAHLVDLIYLDIQLPGITGLDFLKTLAHPPLIIIASAFPEYAVEGFELDVVDYLVKPFSFERFFKSAERAKEHFTQRTQTVAVLPEKDYFFVKTNKRTEKLTYQEILYIEALHNYVAIYTIQRKLVIYTSLKELQEMLPDRNFMRIHKSFIVSLQHISRIEDGKVLIKTAKIPVSRTMKEELTARTLKR